MPHVSAQARPDRNAGIVRLRDEHAGWGQRTIAAEAGCSHGNVGGVLNPAVDTTAASTTANIARLTTSTAAAIPLVTCGGAREPAGGGGNRPTLTYATTPKSRPASPA